MLIFVHQANNIMNDSDKSSKKATSWVFLSHSNEDYDKVAVLRDMLEEQKKRPIMFYLKCMENPVYRKELEGLLKREIDAREQFILCDSENARRSEWVQEEVRYIKSKGRKYQTINIDAAPETIRSEVTDFVSRDKVFISYSHLDIDWARAIKEALDIRGYSAFLDVDTLAPGDDFPKKITDTIDDSDRRGYQICLLSRNFFRSEFCLAELDHILNHTPSRGKWLLLVQIEFIPRDELPESIMELNIPVDFSYGVEFFDAKIERIVDCFLRMDRSHNK